MATNKRIMKVEPRARALRILQILTPNQELADINTNPPPGCQIKLAKEDDLNLWDGTHHPESHSLPPHLD